MESGIARFLVLKVDHAIRSLDHAAAKSIEEIGEKNYIALLDGIYHLFTDLTVNVVYHILGSWQLQVWRWYWLWLRYGWYLLLHLFCLFHGFRFLNFLLDFNLDRFFICF